MALTNERVKLIDKIVKLLALADGTNHDEEAETARRKAAEMMAKHNIELSDMIQKSNVFTETERVQTTREVEPFDVHLVNAIALFNGVCFLIGGRLVSRGYKKCFTFVGREADIEATEYMIDIVKQQRKVAYDKYSKEYIAQYGKARWDKDWTDWRRWMNGFTSGVRTKLKELTDMASQKVQEWGLVPIDPSKQALAWYNENVQKTRDSRQSHMKKGSAAGFEAGRNVSIHNGIGVNKGTKFIE